ncbi:MAG: hypothetical protein ACLQJR_13115 [Stellaceae bacterium]
MPGQFLWGTVFVVLIALLLLEAFPGRKPAPPLATPDGPAASALARDAAPIPCREARRPLLDAGGPVTRAC